MTHLTHGTSPSAVLAGAPSAPALRFSTARLLSGVTLQYAEQGDPRGPAVILLHGYSDSWFSFSPVLPLLPERYRVIALSVRGHGDSARPAGGYRLRELAADVLAFMDALGVARATMVGHSMGSFVAQLAAVAAPARVTGLVLVGSATAVRKFTGIEELAAVVEGLTDPVPEEFVREFQYSTVRQPVPEAFMQRAIDESLKLPARVWRALMDGFLATPPADGLRGSAPRTLIAWGERDPYCSRAEQDALRALIPGAVLRAYPDASHALHWERPAEFTRDLAAFLDRWVPAS